MATLRVVSGCLEITAAMIMLRFNQVDKALLINSGLAIVGPFVLLSTTALGLIGIAEKMSFSKLFLVLAGVSFIFVGILKK
jgi:hypothetical protein